MDVEFKFKIGDVVTHKTMAPPYLVTDGKFGDAKPQLFLVLGRVYDECPGGIQKHYKCRVTGQGRWSDSSGITAQLFQVHEEELVPVEIGPKPTL